MEKILYVDPYQKEYYDIITYSTRQQTQNEYSKGDKGTKKINLLFIFFSVCFLVQTILIAKKLDGFLSSTSWYLIFFPLILAAFVLGNIFFFLDSNCDFFIYSLLIIGFFYSIIFTVASKLEHKITAKYVYFFILIFILFLFLFLF